MSQLGRISGQLLKDNLTRNGHDLTFDATGAHPDGLLHLNVTDRRIGIKTLTPTTELDVNGTTQTTNLIVTNQSDLGDITVLGDTITSNTSTLNLTNATGDQVNYQTKLVVDNIDINDNVISTNDTDVNLVLDPTGTVEVYADTNVYGNIYATGDIQADGNIIVGNANTDNITFNAEVASNIIPNVNNEFTLGNVDYQWKDLWVKNIHADTVNSGSLSIDGINLTLRQGNLYYVSTNGSDTNSGTHQNDPFFSITRAMLSAVAGDTIYVYPGVYEEIFPLEVPNGVTVKGASIRSVTLKPTAATMYHDAFHMNGEATVEDFTITGFYHDPLGSVPEFPINNQGTGHAFRFSWGCLTSKRSPYIRNITVITFGTASVLSINSIKTEVIGSITRIKNVIDELVVNGSVTASAGNTLPRNTSLPASDGTTGTVLQGLIDDVIHVINNGTLKADLPTITPNGAAATTGMLTNAAAILNDPLNKLWIKEEAYRYAMATYSPTTFDETLTKRDMGLIVDALIYDITRGGNEHSVYAGIGFWTQPANDPRGYARADAGHGALIDGGAVDPASKEAAMLFHSVTFLTPAADTLIATNGARVEWLNSFTYFAGKGMYLYSSPEGFAQNGKTRVKITNKTGIWSVGNTLSYYDTDGTTVLASGVIESIDGDFYNIDGRVLGFERIQDRASKIISVHGNAKLSTSIKKFGTASLALDGTGDYLTVPAQADFEFGTGAWCVEAWVYNTTTTGSNQIIFDFRTADPQLVPTIYIDGATNHLHMSTNGAVVIDTGASITLNTWTHIAVAKSGTSTKFFKNGIQVGSTYTDNNNYIQGLVTIGARFNATNGFNGYLDDIKISKGVPRYTGTFTLPTSQLTGDLSTVLLLTLNGSNNSTAIADNGVTLQDLRTSAGGSATVIDFADYSDFGAEVRSIGSASVYGDYGVYGDGVGVIAYLIGQNLAYIGNGKETSNDPTTVIQANEIVELNKAKIYYNSVDHKGDFRVGDLFYVNQQTGEVTFANSNVTIGTSLTFDNGLGDVTFLDATKIETGDFRISSNTIQTLTQDFNVSAASNLINLQSNVNISGNLDVTGNVTIGGNITIGDQSSDTVSFVAGVNSDIVPTNPLGTPTYNLGTALLQWLHLYASQVSIADVQIDTNAIRTTAADTDLTLQANGSGKIYVPNNNVLLSHDLTVNGTTTLKDTNIGTVGTPATLTHIGALNQTGDLTQTGNINLTGTFTTSSYAQFADILITGDQLKTTIDNNDLTLSAHGTGEIYIPSNDVQIDNNLTVTGYIDVNTLNVDTTISSNSFTTGDIVIEDNTIYTTLGNNNLILEAAGSGKIYVPNNSVQLDQNLTVNGTTYLKDTTIVGTVTHTGAVNQTGDLTQTGSTEITGTLTVGSTAQFQDIKIDTNIITTTIGNNNLQLSANGTGRIYVPTNNVTIENTLTVVGTTTTAGISNTGTVTSGTFNTSNISITSNNITSTSGNTNLVLEAAGSGKIYVPNNSVQLDQNLTVNGTTYLKDTTVVGTVTHTGAVTQTGDLTQTGSTEITGTLTVDSTAQFQDIKIDTNVITTTIGNNNLVLKANGTGIVIIPEDDVSITQTLTVTGTTSTTTINNTGTITSDTFNTTNVSINGNTITSRTGDSNLILEASGTGKIYVPNNNVSLGKTLTVNGNTALADTSITGTLTITGATTQTGDVDQTGSYTLHGNLTVDNIAQFKDVNITNNVITTTIGNNNLQLSAAGTGRIYVPTNNVTIENNLTVVGTSTTSTINNTGTVTSGTFSTGNISINGNTIQTTVSNSNLQLQAAGTGYITLEQFDVQENEIRINTGSDMVLTPNGTGIVTVNSTQSIKLPVGNTAARPTGAAGMIRFNSQLSRYEGYDGSNWIRLDGVEDADGNTKITAELTPGANDNTIRFYTNGTQVADLTSTRLNVINLNVDAININDNVISTTTTDTNLVLSPNGIGSVRMGNFAIVGNTITNTVNNSITNFNQTGGGYVKINSTGGFVIPSGITSQRPSLYDVGMMRYNTDPGNYRVEVWDGANWVNAGQAAGGGVTIADAQDIGIVSAIIFG